MSDYAEESWYEFYEEDECKKYSDKCQEESPFPEDDTYN